MKFSEILGVENVAEKLSSNELDKVADRVVKIYDADQASRHRWMETHKDAMNLAMQFREEKNTPWSGASNMKYPLLTTASIQFASRASDSILPGKDYVKATIFGEDKEGDKQKKADRVSKHMSWQLQFDMKGWEAGHERLLHVLPIIDTCHKKTYFDSATGKNVSELVLPQELVIGYWQKPDEQPEYATHIIKLMRNAVTERMRRGFYIEIQEVLDTLENREEENQGESDDARKNAVIEVDHVTPEMFLEQHGWLDLDEDGYDEPYIITLHKETGKIVRIVKRFEEEEVEEENGRIVSIKPHHYFTKYEMMPSLDGSYYGTGWGSLLAPTNHAFDTLINQLIDAGTLNNRQAGFLGMGIKIRGGSTKFRLGEWKRVDSMGSDLKSNIVPLPTNEPSRVLFDLAMGLLQAGKELASTTDVMLGESPGANVPATTVIALIEQGGKVYGGIVKRLYRSMREEYQKLFHLNSIYLNPQEYFTLLDDTEVQEVALTDYDEEGLDVSPIADPSMTSKAQEMAIAQALIETWEYEPQSERQQSILDIYYQKVAPHYVDKLVQKPDDQQKQEEAQKAQEEQQMMDEQQAMAMEGMKQELELKDVEIAEARAKVEELLAKAEKIEAEAEKIEAETKGVENDERGDKGMETTSGDEGNDEEADGNSDGFTGNESFKP